MRTSVIIIFLGISICLYPVISCYIAEKYQQKVIIGYETSVSNADEEKINEEWEKAYAYNDIPIDYMNVLNVNGDGIMGYIKIPKIDVRIPIYHTTSEKSLNKGVGHVEQTDLPTGTKGNHSVLTGHRGVPNAELFTRLDEMEIDDYFQIHILEKVFYYKVIGKTVVFPEEIEKLKAVEGKDLITLVTCTPYGVNTHRLLITGERTENPMVVNTVKEEDDIKNRQIAVLLLILAGLIIIWYPMAFNRFYYVYVKTQKSDFLNNCKTSKIRSASLYQELKRQNEELYLEKQINFSSKSSYERTKINLKYYGIDNNVIGYIRIPKMRIELPILLGAREENMKKGAVHLTETSYPIGGENTNCVIAAHRGYSKTAMFRDIEKLKKGDKVYIQNFRERIVYEVVKIKVIRPEDTGKILIQDGKDMVTLITCHPYRKNSRRYVVFCERV